MAIDPEAVYQQLGRLAQSVPDFITYPPSEDALKWLGQLDALLAEIGDTASLAELRAAAGFISQPDLLLREPSARIFPVILHRALAAAELRAPVTARGNFIPAGQEFDAFAAVGQVLQQATQNLLIVDPYMDEKALTVFAPMGVASVAVRLLADERAHKPSLEPAARAWVAQHGTARPLELRLAPQRALHDRLIVADGQRAWVLTQSLNAFTARSPATIVKYEGDDAGLKIAAYTDIWNTATVVQL